MNNIKDFIGRSFQNTYTLINELNEMSGEKFIDYAVASIGGKIINLFIAILHNESLCDNFNKNKFVYVSLDNGYSVSFSNYYNLLSNDVDDESDNIYVKCDHMADFKIEKDNNELILSGNMDLSYIENVDDDNDFKYKIFYQPDIDKFPEFDTENKDINFKADKLCSLLCTLDEAINLDILTSILNRSTIIINNKENNNEE